MEEFKSLIQLLTMLVVQPRTGFLFIFLTVAAVIDYRTYKIPNWLTVSGMAVGLICNAAAASSTSYSGLLWAFGGLMLGFFMFLPLYVFRAMGAGDVKLMAMVGAFLGLPDTFYAVITIFIVGGIAALGFAVFNKALGRMLVNVKNVVHSLMFSAIVGSRPNAQIEANTSVGKLPYGVSISVGAIGYLVAKQLGYL
jgi:prepilin peptidase CpaA